MDDAGDESLAALIADLESRISEPVPVSPEQEPGSIQPTENLDLDSDLEFLERDVSEPQPESEQPRPIEPTETPDLEFLEQEEQEQPETQDFDFLLDDPVATSREQSESIQNRKAPQKRGRRIGSALFKSVTSNKLERQRPEMDADPDVGDPSEEPGTIEFARARLMEQTRAKKHMALIQPVNLVPDLEVDEVQDIQGKLRLVQGLIDLSQQQFRLSYADRCLLNSCRFSYENQTPIIRSNSTVMTLLHSLTLSKKGLAVAAGSNSNKSALTYSRHSAQAACAALKFSGVLWHGMLKKLVAHQSLTPILCIRKFRYDETPLKNRVSRLNSETEEREQDISDHTKLMQMEFEICALFERKTAEGGSFFVVNGKVPTLLQAIDRTTALCTKQCITNAMSTIPGFPEVIEDEFSWNLHVTTTDRYSANIAAERLLHSESPKWDKVNFFCDTHRVAQAQMKTTDLFPEDNSGLLSVALSQRDMGALVTLREILADVLVASVQVCYDEPPKGRAETYRNEIYDLLLPLPTELSHQRKESKTLVRKKQRHVLASLFNGDLESPEVVHFCVFGCCRNYDHTVLKMRRFGTWALLPHKCPKLVRSRWTNQEISMAWNALLMSHHFLHEKVLVRFTGVPERVIAQPADSMAQIEDQAQDWLFLLDEPCHHDEGSLVLMDPLPALQAAEAPVEAELLQDYAAAVKTAEDAFAASVAQKRAFKRKAGL